MPAAPYVKPPHPERIVDHKTYRCTSGPTQTTPCCLNTLSEVVPCQIYSTDLPYKPAVGQTLFTQITSKAHYEPYVSPAPQQPVVVKRCAQYRGYNSFAASLSVHTAADSREIFPAANSVAPVRYAVIVSMPVMSTQLSTVSPDSHLRLLTKYF